MTFLTNICPNACSIWHGRFASPRSFVTNKWARSHPDNWGNIFAPSLPTHILSFWEPVPFSQLGSCGCGEGGVESRRRLLSYFAYLIHHLLNLKSLRKLPCFYFFLVCCKCSSWSPPCSFPSVLARPANGDRAIHHSCRCKEKREGKRGEEGGAGKPEEKCPCEMWELPSLCLRAAKPFSDTRFLPMTFVLLWVTSTLTCQ